jgi:acetyl esterase/lipase
MRPHVWFATKSVLVLLLASWLGLAGTVPVHSKTQKAGDLIRAEPFPGASFASSAYRILYQSTGLKGEPIAVSGVVVVPGGSAPPQGRDVIAWAHPTTEVAPGCAPSLQPNVFSTIPGLSQALGRGYVVVSADYPGLGTAEPHPYLVGLSEGRAVLDSVRAASLIPGASVGNRFAVWGHSQGGHAALFAGQLARSYAPDLRLVGVAAAAPATDFAELFDDDISTPSGKTLTAMTLWSWSQVFGARLDRVADPDAIASISTIATDCIESIADVIEVRFAERPLQKRFLKVDDLTKIEPWRSLMVQNTPRRAPRGVPVFLAQGIADALVHPAVTAEYAVSLCRRGIAVQFVSLPRINHAFAARQSAGMAGAWMAERFAGAPAPSGCQR